MDPSLPVPEPRPRATRRLLVVAVVAASFLAAELVAGVLLASRETSRSDVLVVPGAPRTGSAARRDSGEPIDTTTLLADPGLLWRNRPGVTRREPVVPSSSRPGPEWTLRVNSDGFRGAERAATTGSAETYRILCIGDSVTFGFNVDQGADYPAALARLLAERHSGLRFEVINAGVPEWSWVQGEAFLLRDGLAVRPDLVIAAHGTADQLRPATVTDSEQIWLNERVSSRDDENAGGILEHSNAWRLVSSWFPAPEHRTRSGNLSPGCRLQAAAGAACKRVSVPEIRDTVQRIGEVSKAAGVDLLLVNLDFAGTAASEAVRQAAIRDGLRYLDHVSRWRGKRLLTNLAVSRRLGLAPSRVPLVPMGHIGPAPAVGRGSQIRFRVKVDNAAGPIRVRGVGAEESGFRFDQEMRDDGSDGDEKAGDRVFSTIVVTPGLAATLSYRFYSGDVAEFDAPPGVAASNSDRTIRFNRDSDAVVESFGRRPTMSDEIHPDAEGQAAIAAAVLAEAEKMPSFRRFAGLPALKPTGKP